MKFACTYLKLEAPKYVIRLIDPAVDRDKVNSMLLVIDIPLI